MNDFRRCLEDLDVIGARKLWLAQAPHLPQPETNDEALAALHMARTAADSIPFRKRAYSHSWCIEHGIPSRLPDTMKPSAERLYPRDVWMVGISVRLSSKALEPAAQEIRIAMENAVHYAVADGRLLDVEHVRARMNEAKETTKKRLFG